MNKVFAKKSCFLSERLIDFFLYLKITPTMNLSASDDLNREEFGKFLQALTHEIRNRLNSITLEATDLAEQAGPGADASRLQGQIQECSAFLKEVRELLAPEAPQKATITPAELVKKWRERKMAGSS
jgi:signal transduction histidine kinase